MCTSSRECASIWAEVLSTLSLLELDGVWKCWLKMSIWHYIKIHRHLQGRILWITCSPVWIAVLFYFTEQGHLLSDWKLQMQEFFCLGKKMFNVTVCETSLIFQCTFPKQHIWSLCPMIILQVSRVTHWGLLGWWREVRNPNRRVTSASCTPGATSATLVRPNQQCFIRNAPLTATQNPSVKCKHLYTVHTCIQRGMERLQKCTPWHAQDTQHTRMGSRVTTHLIGLSDHHKLDPTEQLLNLSYLILLCNIDLAMCLSSICANTIPQLISIMPLLFHFPLVCVCMHVISFKQVWLQRKVSGRGSCDSQVSAWVNLWMEYKSCETLIRSTLPAQK